MKSQIIFLLIFLRQFGIGQEFKEDWNLYINTQNWKIQFVKDSSEFLETKLCGQLHFRNTYDSIVVMRFLVLQLADLDSNFQKRELDYWFMQSCQTFASIENGKEITNFTSFNFKNYYYFLTPCHACIRNEYPNCLELLRNINKYVR